MATRIEKILERARDTLADPNKERWTDARLLRILDEGQQDIARHTRILKNTTEIPLVIGQREYTLPGDVYLLTRATYDDYEIELASHDQMDEQARKDVLNDRRYLQDERHSGYNADFLGYRRSTWETDEGSEIQYVIYDRRNLDKIVVYPIPNEDIAEYTYTFSNSGFIDNVQYLPTTVYGLVTGVDSPDEVSDIYGVVVDADSVTTLINDNCQGIESITPAGFSTVFGITVAIDDDIPEVELLGNELYGVAVDVEDYAEDSVFGLVATIHDPDTTAENFTQIYGVVTAASQLVKQLKLWYIALPTEVTATTDALEVPSMFDTALKHYVVGNALRDDLDTQYRQMAVESLTFYDRELGIARKVDRQDGVRKVGRETTYRSAFE